MKKDIDLLNSPIDSSLRKFALPLAISFLIQNLYTWVDMYYVGKLSSDSLAAIRISGQLIFLMFSVASGFAIGSAIIIARRLGEGKRKEADYTASQSILFMLFISIVVTAIFVFFTDDIVMLMNLDKRVAPLVVTYIRTTAFGIPATFLIFHLNSIIRASGNSVFPMAILIISNVINAVIAPFFIFGIAFFPRLEIQGAGLSTAIAQNLGLVLAIAGVLKGKVSIKFEFKNLKFDYKMYWKIFKLGFPATLQILSVSVNKLFMITLVNSFGVTVLTCYMFGTSIDMMVFMSIFAVGAAVEIITGQNLGAGKIDRIFAYHRSAIKQLFLLLLVFALLIFIFSKSFVGIFIDDFKLILEIEIYLRIAVFAYIPFAVGIISLRVISGSGDYFRSFRLVALTFFAIQLPFAYILSEYTSLSYYGIWYAIFVSHIVFALMAIVSLRRKRWLKTIV